MGKRIVIKGADFSNVAVPVNTIALGNLLNGFLSNTGVVDTSGVAVNFVVSEDYIDLLTYPNVFYDNSQWVAGICLYDSNKTFIKRILISDKVEDPDWIDITQLADYVSTGVFARIAVGYAFATTEQLSISDVSGVLKARKDE